MHCCAQDFFISHSWSDDATLKYAKLQQVADEFEAENGRPPTFWLDKVCIDQSAIGDALRCLPVFEMACQKLLVLNGETYTSRLWCVWELYTFFAISSDMSRMQIEFLSAGDNVNGLSGFDVANAHCFDAADEARLRGIIEAGGADRFNGEHQPPSLRLALWGRVRSADGMVLVVSALIRELGAKMGATGLRMAQKPGKIVNPLSTE